ncbi:MAG: VTT domain-containing protein [Candidatus Paceibacterota bacterium]|jgi:membrane protein DedA with SNARE-associated domain
MFTLAQVVVLLKTYGYLLIFPVAFVEGPIITVICGWLSASGILNVFVVFILLIIANLLGDAFYYAIGYYGGTAVIKKWGKWLRLDLEQTVKLKNHFDNHGGKILLTAKITPHLAAAAVLAGAGLAKYSFTRFLRYSLIIEIPKTMVLLLVGYLVGDAYQKIVVYLDYLGAIVSVIVAGLLIYGFYYWRRFDKLTTIQSQKNKQR